MAEEPLEHGGELLPSTEVKLSTGKITSFQILQDVYNEVTGKKEKLSKSISISHITDRDDLVQLHAKIQQTLEQYNVKESNSSVTIYYDDDNKETFSSFDRFSVYDQTKNAPQRMYI